MENIFEPADTTRREVLRKALFIAPFILTLPVIPSFAKSGSSGGDERDGGDGGYGHGHQGGSSRRCRKNHGSWFWFFGL